jgi:hypothetical protein
VVGQPAEEIQYQLRELLAKEVKLLQTIDK